MRRARSNDGTSGDKQVLVGIRGDWLRADECCRDGTACEDAAFRPTADVSGVRQILKPVFVYII